MTIETGATAPVRLEVLTTHSFCVAAAPAAGASAAAAANASGSNGLST
jgi:hypothetical protein